MSSTAPTARLRHSEAAAIYAQLECAWAPLCHRIQAAGSVRRSEPHVGDIEVVCVPKEHSMFQKGLAGSIEEMLANGSLKRGRCNGPKFQQYFLPAHGMAKLDLFLTGLDNFGLILAIRTGPASYSKSIVTQRSKQGLLKSWLKVSEGQLTVIDTGGIIPTPEEYDFLQKYAGGWVEPHQRS